VWVITVTTKLLAADGRADELAGLLAELCISTLKSMPGCRRSECSRSAHDERRFLLLTSFEDEEAHAAHANSQAFADALPGVMDCLEGLPDIEIYEGF
jgi:quinol monooxygenase YgiN